MLYVTPSLTSYQHLNPTIREFVYSNTPDKTLVDVRTYYADLTNQSQPIEWKLEYSMKDMYGLSDLQPSSFDGLVTRMRTSQPQLFDKFWVMHHNSYQPAPECDKACKKLWECGMYHVCVCVFIC